MNTRSDQLSVHELAQALWHGRWFILAVTLLLTASAAVAVKVLPKRFTAIAVVIPAEPASQGGLGGLASRYGGLASLAGISLPSDGSASEAIATMESDGLTMEYIRRNDLLPVLFPEKWDPVAKRWKDKDAPTLRSGVDLFKHRVKSVMQDPKSGLIHVSISWTDAKIAEKWANDLVSETNTHMRQRAIDQSARNIEYLKSQVQSTNVVELRTAIFSLMESEIQKGMLARGNDEFALRVIDPAMAPERPSSPRSSLLLAASIVGGLFISALLVVVRSSLRRL
jgi:uncharacterized protein involved in exopolysaccharide biosynthesis